MLSTKLQPILSSIQSPYQSPVNSPSNSNVVLNRPTHYVRPKLDHETIELNKKREAELIEQEREKNRCIYEYCPEPYSKLFELLCYLH